MAIGRIPEPLAGVQESLFTTKGDLVVATGPSQVVRQGVGTNNQVLMADSVQADGVKWANEATATLTAKGDILTATGANTLARLAVGTNGHTLVADSSEVTGLKWAAPAGGASFVGCLAYRSTSLTVSYNVWTSVPFDDEGVDSDNFHSTSTNTDRITIPTGKGGKYLINAQLLWDQKTSGSQQFRIRKNGSSNLMGSIEGNTGYVTTSISQIAELTAGDYITVEAYSDSSGGNTIQPYMDRTNFFQVLYLGA